jgi:hypothetical protein
MIHRAPEEFEFSLLGKKARDFGCTVMLSFLFDTEMCYYILRGDDDDGRG